MLAPGTRTHADGVRPQVLWPSLVVRSGAALLVPLATSRAALAGGLGLVAFGANAVSTVGSAQGGQERERRKECRLIVGKATKFGGTVQHDMQAKAPSS